MILSSDLISQFVKSTNDTQSERKEGTLNGTIKEYDGKLYVQLDGSDLLTPISSTTVAKPGERVMVTIKQHEATVTGNLTSPSASDTDVKDVRDQISEFEIIVAGKVSTEEFEAQVGRIDELVSDNVVIKEKLTAAEADIDTLTADNATITGRLTAAEAEIGDLKTTKLDAEVADIKYAAVEDLEATNAEVHNLSADYGDFKVLATDKFAANEAAIGKLETEKLSAAEAELKYANIDFGNIGQAAIEHFFAKSGLIENVVVGDQVITGKLVGVTISGDLIEGNTIVAEKLVIKGEDGLYYKLNTNGSTVSTEQTDYNSLNGSVIKAKSITAEKVAVDDLMAFDATIGGFAITSDSLYSGVKSSVDNTTQGVYLDKNGQMAVGDSANYLKYFQDADGAWKLAISAQSFIFSGTNKTVEETIADSVDNIEIGGRNLIIRAGALENTYYGENGQLVEAPSCDTASMTIYIDIAPGAKYTFSRKDGLGDYFSFNWYDANAAYLGHKLVTEIADGSVGAYTWTAPSDARYLLVSFPWDIDSEAKLEKGDKATDWSLSPEDVEHDIDDAKNAANDALERVSTAQLAIDSITGMISNLVVDENGASLMTQTSEGWVFGFGETLDKLNKAVEDLKTLNGDVENANGDIEALTNIVGSLQDLGNYVKIVTQGNQPCLELGNLGEFKVRITNTEIQFIQGTSVVAHISNRKLHIDSADIDTELKFGGFALISRENGNAGFIWKGEE